MVIASQLKKNYFWNTLGSLTNALTSALLLIVVTRSLGSYIGGIFSLAYALGQQFQVLGAFEIRPFQATDASEKYPFGVYLAARLTTCLVMIFSLAGYALYSNGLTLDALLLFGIASLKLFDAFEDVYHGMYQQHGRLDIAGRAFFFRTIITFCSFSIGCVFMRSLGTACLLSFFASAIATTLLNLPKAKQFCETQCIWNWNAIGGLLLSCLPLFLGVFLANDIINVPRYAIENLLTREDQTVYAIIYMPALVINLLVGFVFKPLLTTLADTWRKGNRRNFAGVIAKGASLVVIVSAFTFILAYPFGIPILSFLYGVNLDSYLSCLMTMLIGGTLNALSIIFYYALVTMRLQVLVVVGYGLSALASHLLANIFVTHLGLMGAAMLYDVAMAIVCIAFFLLAIVGFTQKRMKPQN